MACNCGKQQVRQPGVIEAALASAAPPLDDGNSAMYAWLAPVHGITVYVAMSGNRYRVWETGQMVRVANIDAGEFRALGFI